MAFRSNGPVTLALPPFRGATRRIILLALGVYFAALLLSLYSADFTANLLNFFVLHPLQATHKLVWEVVTYPFVGGGLLGTLFALLSFWFFGAALEDERGPRWMTEYFLVATIGGGLAASLISLATNGRVRGLESTLGTAGMWPFVMALILAYARFHPDQELRLMFVLMMKAKHLAAIYLLVYLATTLGGGDRLGALTALCNALAGYVFLRLAPRMGFRVAVSEWWFGLRNAYYRSKRRRAAKKFTVYMRKQGKDVSLDADGRYVGPDEEKRDLKDKRWMN